MAPKQFVYRVQGIPAGLDSDTVRSSLRVALLARRKATEEQLDGISNVDIVQSCDSKDYSCALLDWQEGSECFSFHEEQVKVDGQYWTIDRHFLGFTQLFTPAAGCTVIAESKNDPYRMWLRDFLSKDLPRCRTLTYGYNSKLLDRGIDTIQDYASGLLEEIEMIRDTVEARKRPIFFIAHSFGGIMLKYCFNNAVFAQGRGDENGASLYKATYGILFFGTPHRGMNVEDIRKMIGKDADNPRHLLLDQIRLKSDILTSELSRFIDNIGDRKIVSFYEQKQTRGLTGSGQSWARNGSPEIAVEVNSALLQLPSSMETPIPLNADHSDMVKFSSEFDKGYRSVIKRLKRFEEDALGVVAHAKYDDARAIEGLKRSLSYPEMDIRYEQIEVVDNEPLEWIFKSKRARGRPPCDFHEWLEQGKPLYWISGKAGAGKSTLMKFLWDTAETENHLKDWAKCSEVIKLYFFFWKPGSRLQKSLEGFYRALIFQLVQSDSSLAALAIQSLDEHRALGLDQPIDPRIVWSESRLWSLFKVLVSEVLTRSRRLCFFIDALDECEDNPNQLLKAISELVEFSGVKVCASSRPDSPFTVFFNQIPQLKLEHLTYDAMLSDVESKLRTGLEDLGTLQFWEIDDFISETVEAACGIFLWSRLVTEMLLTKLSKGPGLTDLQLELRSIPNELADLFQYKLDTLSQSERRQAFKYFSLKMSMSESIPLMPFALALWEPLTSAKASIISTLPRSEGLEYVEQMRRFLVPRTAGLLGIRDGDYHRDIRTYRNEVLENPRQDVLCTMKYRVDFLHRSVHEWLLDVDKTSFSTSQPRDSLEALLRASVLISEWSPRMTRYIPSSGCAETLRFEENLNFAFSIAAKLEAIFEVTNIELLDEFGSILSRKSCTEPWTDCYVGWRDFHIAVRDFDGLAISQGLWLYGNAKAQQKDSAVRSDYATYLLACIAWLQVPDYGDERMERISAFTKQRFIDGANIHTKFAAINVRWSNTALTHYTSLDNLLGCIVQRNVNDITLFHSGLLKFTAMCLRLRADTDSPVHDAFSIELKETSSLKLVVEFKCSILSYLNKEFQEHMEELEAFCYTTFRRRAYNMWERRSLRLYENGILRYRFRLGHNRLYQPMSFDQIADSALRNLTREQENYIIVQHKDTQVSISSRYNRIGRNDSGKSQLNTKMRIAGVDLLLDVDSELLGTSVPIYYDEENYDIWDDDAQNYIDCSGGPKSLS